MIVTDKKYFMEKAVIHKLDLMIERFNRGQDNLLLVEGSEGDGKTTMSIACAYYAAFQTKREFSVDNIFFNVEELIDFAKNTEGQILIWDEPAMDGLSSEWWKETQKNLIKLLMIVRKKRHFFIFNVTKFFKFAEYIVVDRAIGMIHVYSRGEMKPGRFLYIRRKNLERLFYDYKFKKQRNYRKFSSLKGSFPNVMRKKYGIIDVDAYEKKKDMAISMIGISKKKEKATKDSLRISKIILGLKDKQKMTAKQIIDYFNGFGIDLSERAIYQKLLTGRENAIMQ